MVNIIYLFIFYSWEGPIWYTYKKNTKNLRFDKDANWNTHKNADLFLGEMVTDKI